MKGQGASCSQKALFAISLTDIRAVLYRQNNAGCDSVPEGWDSGERLKKLGPLRNPMTDLLHLWQCESLEGVLYPSCFEVNMLNSKKIN